MIKWNGEDSQTESHSEINQASCKAALPNPEIGGRLTHQGLFLRASETLRDARKPFINLPVVIAADIDQHISPHRGSFHQQFDNYLCPVWNRRDVKRRDGGVPPAVTSRRKTVCYVFDLSKGVSQNRASHLENDRRRGIEGGLVREVFVLPVHKPHSYPMLRRQR